MIVLPRLSSGAIDRVSLAAQLGWSVREVYLAIDAWRRLYDRQPASTLTFERYIGMMMEAGLRPKMVGLRSGQWNLARPNDDGPYAEGNCRFIRREQNIAERKEGYQQAPEFRAKMRAMALARPKMACPDCGRVTVKAMIARWHGDRCRSIAA